MRIFNVSRAGYTPRIRIINLVDILFILLLFFIATTTFRVDQPNAVKVSLPEAKTAEALGKQKMDHMTISVTSNDVIFVDQKKVNLDALTKLLREAKAKNPDVLLEFSADKSVSYGTVVAVVDAARDAGVRNITAFTKKSVK
jgi:biopolymer transport protein ExbD